MKSMVFLFVLVLALTACQTSQQSSVGNVFNDTLRDAMLDSQAAKTAERLPLFFENGEEVTRCVDYLDKSKTLGLEETITNQTSKSEYLVCDALAIVESSSPIAEAGNKNDILKAIANSLDFRAFPNSMSRMADDSAFTMAAMFESSSLSIDDDTLRYTAEDWVLSLQLLAVRDVNNNGSPDWIVWIADEAMDGVYRGYGTLVLLDPQSKTVLTQSDVVYK